MVTIFILHVFHTDYTGLDVHTLHLNTGFYFKMGFQYVLKLCDMAYSNLF